MVMAVPPQNHDPSILSRLYRQMAGQISFVGGLIAGFEIKIAQGGGVRSGNAST
ncbi:hypothetical protein [Mesorhizobium tamadayense]|uniref:hypothetical protein n=1 Tax=Mesorhizobium tamadayense TaxID=425306 RepID=UPI00142DEDE1|nr:hypothetical protein [Mesorhizobium tamadayense]